MANTQSTIAKLTQALASRSYLSCSLFLLVPSALETAAVDASDILDQRDRRGYSSRYSQVTTPSNIFAVSQCHDCSEYAHHFKGPIDKRQRVVTGYRGVENLMSEAIILRIQTIDKFYVRCQCGGKFQ